MTTEPEARRPRWPAGVYATGTEPDYRFSLANERTFLAWIRTSLALVAGAVALDVVATDYPAAVVAVVAGSLAALGAAGPVVAWLRWSRTERAIRRSEPLPGFATAAVLCAGLLLIVCAALALVLS